MSEPMCYADHQRQSRRDHGMRIYLATPYSDPDPAVRLKRFHHVNAVAARLMARGCMVFSPISHTHPIAEAGDLPRGWEFWSEYDRTFIEWADVVLVLMVDGYRESKGVQSEIRLASELGKAVFYGYGDEPFWLIAGPKPRE